MSLLEELPFNQNILYEDGYQYHDQAQSIYFQKSLLKTSSRPQYFFKSFVQENGNLKCQGYIYFYLNSELKTSDFIGVFVKNEYRNSGLASLLVSNWIQFCLNNGYQFLGTNKTQRKPFLLYLLKTYGFEILDESFYKTSNRTIDICKSNFNNTKYLLFKNPSYAESFSRGKIIREDNYQLITKMSEDMSYLDSVILSHKYNLVDSFKAEEKSTLVIQKHKK